MTTEPDHIITTVIGKAVAEVDNGMKVKEAVARSVAAITRHEAARDLLIALAVEELLSAQLGYVPTRRLVAG